MSRTDLNNFDCVECGSVFDVEDTVTCGNTVYCPFCGRANFIGDINLDGYQTEACDVGEPYLNGYLSETDDYNTNHD